MTKMTVLSSCISVIVINHDQDDRVIVINHDQDNSLIVMNHDQDNSVIVINHDQDDSAIVMRDDLLHCMARGERRWCMMSW